MWIEPPISNFWSGKVLLIPTLPFLVPTADTVTNSSTPSLTLKKLETVRIPTWRLSSSGKITSVKVEIPDENKFLTLRSVASIWPVITISLKVAMPDTLKLSRSKESVPSKL